MPEGGRNPPRHSIAQLALPLLFGECTILVTARVSTMDFTDQWAGVLWQIPSSEKNN